MGAPLDGPQQRVQGRAFQPGTSFSFTVRVPTELRENHGLLLRREYDFSAYNQKAAVSVDGYVCVTGGEGACGAGKVVGAHGVGCGIGLATWTPGITGCKGHVEAAVYIWQKDQLTWGVIIIYTAESNTSLEHTPYWSLQTFPN